MLLVSWEVLKGDAEEQTFFHCLIESFSVQIVIFWDGQVRCELWEADV